ncbi:hypothetical protein CBR_g78855 [Chara braunii]|uniref:SMP-30/Gluconolactonase/LRE-like region domain-containing protein n=1 Tax=Chara braunii TaxID=69332 RepID=A0A388KAH5_CHABU|nr:hypothetical protein CBR_g78855 [Chara braunii]|eukprot:GBG67074.1 hypothetical protein CBR_g78855 [Chara braunii]
MMTMAITMLMLMTTTMMPIRAVVGAEGISTAKRGRESVAGRDCAQHDIGGDVRGERRLQADPSPSFSITNTTLLGGSRVVLTVASLFGTSSGTLACFTWVRRAVFTTERGVFFFVQHDDCWNTTTKSHVKGGRSLHKGDLRGMANSGEAEGNSSLLTLPWTSQNPNGTAVMTAESGDPHFFWGFDLSRNEGYIVAPVEWGLAFISKMDGSRTTYGIPKFGANFGAFNPNRTILYIARRRCLECSVMDGESPDSFVSDFRTVACANDNRSWASLSFGHRSFLQDGSYLYARDDVNATILGFDLITGTWGTVTGTEIPNYVADNHNPVGVFSSREIALTQDGCNLFFVAYGGTNIMRVAFDKPGGHVVRVDMVARCVLAGGCSVGSIALDNDDSHLYVSIHTGQLFQMPINEVGLHRCSGAFSTSALPTSSSSADPSSLETSSPGTAQTSPTVRGGVSGGVMAGVVVAVALVAFLLGGALVFLVSRSRKSAMATSGGMTARSSALEPPVAKSSALERRI